MKPIFRLIILSILFLNMVFAHCQIPCGIYDDVLRVVSIQEDINTIQKSINKIQELGDFEKSIQNQNQLVRWVNNKESHAQLIQDVISEYFLAQRIKPKFSNDKDYDKYVMLTTSCQRIIFYAIKNYGWKYSITKIRCSYKYLKNYRFGISSQNSTSKGNSS